MKTIEVCPSTLRPGFSTYSPQAVKELFDGVVVSPFIDIELGLLGKRTLEEIILFPDECGDAAGGEFYGTRGNATFLLPPISNL